MPPRLNTLTDNEKFLLCCITKAKVGNPTSYIDFNSVLKIMNEYEGKSVQAKQMKRKLSGLLRQYEDEMGYVIEKVEKGAGGRKRGRGEPVVPFDSDTSDEEEMESMAGPVSKASKVAAETEKGKDTVRGTRGVARRLVRGRRARRIIESESESEKEGKKEIDQEEESSSDDNVA